MDLPCDDPTATFSDYADVVIEALHGTGEDVILVGHSLAGHTIPLVAARRPVRVLIYVCALIAAPGSSLADQLGTEADMLVQGYEAGLDVDSAGRSSWVDEAVAVQTFYEDCSPEVTRQALADLRAQSTYPYRYACPLAEHPKVPTTYVLCNEDQLVNPAWSRTAAVEVLGADLIELPGGHSPFLSRPSALVAVLDGIDR